MRNNKIKGRDKGFTLVELIVVIVILAILAAILVPALLGYVDQAKKKQIYLNARACMTAAQAKMTELYAQGKTDIEGAKTNSGNRYCIIEGTNFAEEILDIADVDKSKCSYVAFGCDAPFSADGTLDRSAYKVTYFIYTEDDETVYYYNNKWIDEDDFDVTNVNDKYDYVVLYDESKFGSQFSMD